MTIDTPQNYIIDRSTRLFTFLKELTSSRMTSVRRIEEYEEVLWLDDLPREPGWLCAAWDREPNKEEEATSTWVQAVKPKLKNPPKPSEKLSEWMEKSEIEDARRETPPSLKTQIYEAHQRKNESGELEDYTVAHTLLEHPEIKAAWDLYVSQFWLPWAEDTKRLLRIQEIYGKVFSIYQKQLRLGESYEVVLGLGFLTLVPEGGAEIRRHIVTVQTELTFESARGILKVGPAGEGARPVLEQDMLEMKDRPDNDKIISDQLNQLGDEIWNRDHLDTTFRGWVNFISSEGQYNESLVRQSLAKSFPIVHFAPALILRKRTERSLIRVFQEIIKQLGEAKDLSSVPPGIVSVVSVVEKPEDGEESDNSTKAGQQISIDEELYFPLPANEQQKKIIKLFSDHNGVVVQGPPGTGKSQTIANLVCHLLAQGKKILITSQTARALESLKDKIPEPLRALCVSLLGNDRKAFEGLEGSVLGITNRFNNWDQRGAATLIENRKVELHQCREKDAQIRRNLRAIRESEVVEHIAPFGAYKGKLSEISLRIKKEKSIYSWIAPYVVDSDVPLSNIEIGELIQLKKNISVEKQGELSSFNLDLSTLPNPSFFEELLGKETSLLRELDSYRAVMSDPELLAIRGLEESIRNEFQSEIKAIRSKINEIKGHIHQWVSRAVIEVLGERDRVWRDLLFQTESALKEIESDYKEASQYRVIYKKELDLLSVKSDCERFLEHLKLGGKFSRFLFPPKITKECQYFLGEVTLNARPINSQDSLEQFYKWVGVSEKLNNLKHLWGRFVELHDQGITTLFAEYSDLCEPLKEMLALYDRVAALRSRMQLINGLTPPVWHDTEQLQRFNDLFNAIDAEYKLSRVRKEVEEIKSLLSKARDAGETHSFLPQLISVVERREVSEYRRLYAELINLSGEKKQLASFWELQKKLDSSCPALTRQILESESSLEEELCFLKFEEAWNWCRVDRWLTDLANPESSARYTSELESLQGKIRRIITELATEHSWLHFFSRLTEAQRQHLIAWAQNMKKIGKGTGKYAPRHRAAARENLSQCRSAIPAWIMPIYRIAESVEPRPKSFDVVIIDEASQSGPEALFLEYIADKIIVVGDDKQISPESIGIHREDVERLRKKYLHDLPHKDNIGVDNSFFDMACIRFPGFIRLREHFRCMPEIIQFSNNLFYAGEPLQPLKQFNSLRLDPVKTVFVSGGYEKGTKRTFNPSEAEILVEKVAECCKDPRYKGKSMGVIVLKSTSSQAYEIAKMLLEKIGPEEVESRKLICGDPYDFQGDERDVIFLSMVAAPRDDSKIQALTGDRYNKPFNVAASRAKEQMWLFHSVQLSDLSPDCLRYRLIEYARNPQIEPSAFDHTKVFEDRLVEPFDSLFEQRVFLKIVGKGFRVIPQYDVAGYRIDLVVEGMNGRLAVECDGDFWHGAEQYEKDSARQRQLERCGWTFWRVRESSFNRDSDSAMRGLWQTLERCGILTASSFKQNVNENGNKLQVQEQTSSGTSLIISQDSFNTSNAEESRSIDMQNFTVGVTGEIVDFDPNLFEEPYQYWKGDSIADPRLVAQKLIIEGLVSIVEVEGPIQAGFLFRQYIKHAGIAKLGNQIEGLLMRALEKALRAGVLEKRDESGIKGKLQWNIRIAGGPFVRLRPANGRGLEDIPPSEIGKLMSVFLNKGSLDDEELFRMILGAYGMKRITTNTKEILTHCLKNWVNPSAEMNISTIDSIEEVEVGDANTILELPLFNKEDFKVN